MSAFLKAIENIDNIYLNPKLKDVFSTAMTKLHDYFTKNELMNIIDLDKFFENYFYRHTNPNNTKLVVRFNKYKNHKLNTAKRYREEGTYGMFFDNTSIGKMTLDIFEAHENHIQNISDEDFEDLVHDFIHEFIHFITLSGKVSLTFSDGKKVTLEKLQKLDERKYFHYFNFTFYLEPFTELMALQIMGWEKTNSYTECVKLLQLHNAIFEDKQYESDFLKRLATTFFRTMGSKHGNQYMTLMNEVFINYMDGDLAKSRDNIKKATDILFEVGKHRLHIFKNYIKPAQFVNYQFGIMLQLPYESTYDYSKNIQEFNKIYAENLLKQREITPSKENVSKVVNFFNKTLKDLKTVNQEDYYRFDSVIRSNYRGAKLNFAKENNTLCIYSMEDYDDRTGLITPLSFTQETFKKTKLHSGFNKINGITLFEKNENEPLKIYTSKERRTYLEEVRNPHLFARVEIFADPLIVDYDNGKLTLSTKRQTKTFNLNENTKEMHLLEFEDDFEKLIREIVLTDFKNRTQKAIVPYKKHELLVVENKNTTNQELPNTIETFTLEQVDQYMAHKNLERNMEKISTNKGFFDALSELKKDPNAEKFMPVYEKLEEGIEKKKK